MATTALPIESQWDFSNLAFLMKDLVVSGTVFIGGNGISSTELGFLDGVSAGTATASKAVVLDGSKGIATITSATITTLTSTTGNFTNVDAGASGTAGTVDVFPSTASKGKLQISVTDQTGNTTVGLTIGAMADARTITLRDPGAAASFVTTTDATAAAITTTAVELNYLDQDLATNTLTRGAGVDTAESYKAGISRNGGVIVTTIVLDLTTLVGSATDLDIIGETGGAADCHWGQITTAKSGTLVGGKVTCLEVPAGGSADIDFYSATVSTGAQDVDITSLTETVLVTAGGAWTSGATKGMTGLPPANDYLYIVNGAASGGTFTAGKFLIELYGV